MDGIRSSAQAVRTYSLIMMWPLSVRPKKEKPVDSAQAAMVEAVRNAVCKDNQWKDNQWEEVSKRWQYLRPLEGSPDEEPILPTEYAELCYFYPFVRQFLFEKSPLLSLYRLTTIDGIEVEFEREGQPSAAVLEVPRINLYLFATGDVFLVSEITAQGAVAWDGSMETLPAKREMRPLWLAECLHLNDRLRRAYPPFFHHNKNGEDEKARAGYAMKRAVWRKGDKPVLPDASPDVDRWGDLRKRLPGKQDKVLEGDDGLPVSLYERWRMLLPTLDCTDYKWTLVQDERMPAMTSLALDHPEEVEKGDWVRLANCDEAGEGLPYSAAFLKDFEDKNCYDRFWHPGHPSQSTRYVTTGFCFAQVVKAGDDPCEWPLFQTFRTLYFHMMLISHFHQAALQNLSDQMALVVQNSNLADPDSVTSDHKKRMEKIMGQVIQFTQAYWFTDLSNQIMARELFDLTRKHQGVDALYAQVSAEAREINAFLNRMEDQRSARAAERFNRIAAIGAGLGVSVGAMGMNMLIPGQTYDWHSLYAWLHGGFILFATATLLSGGVMLMDRSGVKKKGWFFVVSLVLSVIFALCLGQTPL